MGTLHDITSHTCTVTHFSHSGAKCDVHQLGPNIRGGTAWEPILGARLIETSGWWIEPLSKIFISWDDYSQYMEEKKSHVPNHQPELGMSIMNGNLILFVHISCRGLVAGGLQQPWPSPSKGEILAAVVRSPDWTDSLTPNTQKISHRTHPLERLKTKNRNYRRLATYNPS